MAEDAEKLFGACVSDIEYFLRRFEKRASGPKGKSYEQPLERLQGLKGRFEALRSLLESEAFGEGESEALGASEAEKRGKDTQFLPITETTSEASLDSRLAGFEADLQRLLALASDKAEKSSRGTLKQDLAPIEERLGGVDEDIGQLSKTVSQLAEAFAALPRALEQSIETLSSELQTIRAELPGVSAGARPMSPAETSDDEPDSLRAEMASIRCALARIEAAQVAQPPGRTPRDTETPVGSQVQLESRLLHRIDGVTEAVESLRWKLDRFSQSARENADNVQRMRKTTDLVESSFQAIFEAVGRSLTQPAEPAGFPLDPGPERPPLPPSILDLSETIADSGEHPRPAFPSGSNLGLRLSRSTETYQALASSMLEASSFDAPEHPSAPPSEPSGFPGRLDSDTDSIKIPDPIPVPPKRDSEDEIRAQLDAIVAETPESMGLGSELDQVEREAAAVLGEMAEKERELAGLQALEEEPPLPPVDSFAPPPPALPDLPPLLPLAHSLDPIAVAAAVPGPSPTPPIEEEPESPEPEADSLANLPPLPLLGLPESPPAEPPESEKASLARLAPPPPLGLTEEPSTASSSGVLSGTASVLEAAISSIDDPLPSLEEDLPTLDKALPDLEELPPSVEDGLPELEDAAPSQEILPPETSGDTLQLLDVAIPPPLASAEPETAGEPSLAGSGDDEPAIEAKLLESTDDDPEPLDPAEALAMIDENSERVTKRPAFADESQSEIIQLGAEGELALKAGETDTLKTASADGLATFSGSDTSPELALSGLNLLVPDDHEPDSDPPLMPPQAPPNNPFGATEDGAEEQFKFTLDDIDF